MASLSDFRYQLPPELIANEPLAARDASRMLVVDRHPRSIKDLMFRAFPGLLCNGDILVVNNTRVFPARLLGKTSTGAGIEVFLIEQVDETDWVSLTRPARRLRIGKEVSFGDQLTGTVISKHDDGKVTIRFTENVLKLVETVGRTPLPPYIKRDVTGPDADRERYQTVYATKSGAIAAPTAGLHFTPKIIDEVRNRGVELVEITLHVGYGTFEPVRAKDITGHHVLPEKYEIDAEVAESLDRARSERKRIVAVGTTTTRALESNLARFESFRAGRFVADMTIRPGYRFRAVGALLTNFHLPESSLLILVSTFGGHELIMRSYEHAVAGRYRFYSYGDCMFII